MRKVKHFYRPENLESAMELLGADENMIIGGGTTVALSVPDGISGLVSLKRLGLDEISTSGEKIRIGSGVTIQKLYKYQEIIPLWDGILTRGSRNVGSTLNRNLVTVGGNITSVFPWSDLPVVLMVLDGEIIKGDGSKATIQEFFSKSPVREGYGRKTIVTGIELDKGPADSTYFWETFQKTKVDFAMTTVCGRIKVTDGIIKDLRLSVGAVSHLPVRLADVEDELTGSERTEEKIRAAVRRGLSKVKFRTDFRAGSDYIREVTENLIVKNMMSH